MKLHIVREIVKNDSLWQHWRASPVCIVLGGAARALGLRGAAGRQLGGALFARTHLVLQTCFLPAPISWAWASRLAYRGVFVKGKLYVYINTYLLYLYSLV